MAQHLEAMEELAGLEVIMEWVDTEDLAITVTIMQMVPTVEVQKAEQEL
jgi:hypothetical protein